MIDGLKSERKGETETSPMTRVCVCAMCTVHWTSRSRMEAEKRGGEG